MKYSSNEVKCEVTSEFIDEKENNLVPGTHSIWVPFRVNIIGFCTTKEEAEKIEYVKSEDCTI